MLLRHHNWIVPNVKAWKEWFTSLRPRPINTKRAVLIEPSIACIQHTPHWTKACWMWWALFHFYSAAAFAIRANRIQIKTPFNQTEQAATPSSVHSRWAFQDSWRPLCRHWSVSAINYRLCCCETWESWMQLRQHNSLWWRHSARRLLYVNSIFQLRAHRILKALLSHSSPPPRRRQRNDQTGQAKS